jgi:hypothetical protein
MIPEKYGVVYTPHSLSDFVANLLFELASNDNSLLSIKCAIDPACGEGRLLQALKVYFKDKINYIGIDVDKDVVPTFPKDIHLIHDDAILPKGACGTTIDYWLKTLEKIQLVIANPPWSSEKIYSKADLEAGGFKLIKGQYDSYVLFLELAYSILQENGYFAFILPDSLFEAQNEDLRRFLASKMQIKVIARLGEKLFENVNRATTVIICKKTPPMPDSKTTCFRLSTDERKKILSGNKKLIASYQEGKHTVFQRRFITNEACNFDIDTREEDEDLLKKIKEIGIDISNKFRFGRGVEISKIGAITICPLCSNAQGYSKKQLADSMKRCSFCKEEIAVNSSTIEKIILKSHNADTSPIIVGEDIHRYSCQTNNFIVNDIKGINYKDISLFSSPKLLIRKTGLGIYASIDYTDSKTSQTVYILKFLDKNCHEPLEYYLALLNSRVIYYYYLKTYGENEWKSHPYLTKQIIFSLPIADYKGDDLDKEIVALASKLLVSKKYCYETDLALERLIFIKYGLNSDEIQTILKEINSLPDLGAVNNMKIKDLNYV